MRLAADPGGKVRQQVKRRAADVLDGDVAAQWGIELVPLEDQAEVADPARRQQARVDVAAEILVEISRLTRERQMLQRITTPDAIAALQMTKQLRYDLIVTDLEMPQTDGFDLITRLRKDDRFKSTPIVIITSRANPEHRRRAKELGVRALVAKPITRRKLLEALAAR